MGPFGGGPAWSAHRRSVHGAPGYATCPGVRDDRGFGGAACRLMQGYLGRPDATAATINSDGWLHTGDVGYVDADGDIFIVDRVKELIKYKGMQVAPAELEAVLLGHPAVADAAVIPSPDEEAGEVPKAFVVLKTPTPADDILAFVADKVAPHKKIGKWQCFGQVQE